MSVGFANAVADGLRYNNVAVSFEPGWQTRGNGQVFPGGKPIGLITHHTGDNYGAGLSILVNGRSDLDPPLCNCCTYPDGRIHIIAAHVANHAGAAGGPSMGPLPITGLFNRLVWGNEVMFPGTKAWTAAQYRSARVLSGVIAGILGYRNNEYTRGHYETSREGKWDPGAGTGAGIHFDMARFRAEVWDALQNTAARTKEAPEVIQLPATPTPTSPASLPTTWPQRNFDVVWNVTGGWEGDAAYSWGVQDWDNPASGVRGFLYLASWIMPGGKLIPVDPAFAKGGGGYVATPHCPTKEYAAPVGCVGVTLNYAAPGGAYVATGRSK